MFVKAKYKNKVIEICENDILINAKDFIVLKNQQFIYKKDILEDTETIYAKKFNQITYHI